MPSKFSVIVSSPSPVPTLHWGHFWGRERDGRKLMGADKPDCGYSHDVGFIFFQIDMHFEKEICHWVCETIQLKHTIKIIFSHLSFWKIALVAAPESHLDLLLLVARTKNCRSPQPLGIYSVSSSNSLETINSPQNNGSRF